MTPPSPTWLYKSKMSSVDPESVEDGQEKAARAEELKNTANQFFKGRNLFMYLCVDLTIRTLSASLY